MALEWASTCQEMGILEDTRAALPELPDRLGKVLNVRNWGKDIILEPDGRCKRPYCKYTGECRQDMSTSCMASRKDKYAPWKMKKAIHGHEEQVEAFMTELANKAMEVA